MSSLQIGRLLISPPAQWQEQLGDPAASLGGAVVANTRTAPAFSLQIGTAAADGQVDTVAARLTIRRQLRALLNNAPLKFQGYLYVVYSDDPENNGWYVPDQFSMQDLQAPTGLATGWWTMQGNWYRVGGQRTHREARQVWMKDLRTGLYERDVLGWIISTDFSALPALALSVLPHAASGAINTINQQYLNGPVRPTGRDTGACQVLQGLPDLAIVSYERPESALNASDVIVYDRRGQITAPSTGPDTSWQEVYGPDWQWNWTQAATPTPDAPVLDNGLVRIRYDQSAGKPGLTIDAWTGSAYAEQGKVTFQRVGDATSFDDTWVSAGLREWTPDRAILWLTLRSSTDAASLERIFVTLQRGELGAVVECYPAVELNGTTRADAALYFTVPVADTNDSLIMNGSQATPPTAAGTAFLVGTAGTGGSTFFGGGIGGAWPSSENWVAMLRYSAVATLTPFQVNFTAVQSGLAVPVAASDSSGYGTARNALELQGGTGLGYNQLGVHFIATQAQQVLEVELITLGSGTSNTVDGAASNGRAATATRTSDANAHATQATWPNGFTGLFRVFARVKTSASTLNIYAKTGATTGATVTTTSTSYVWKDLGEINANNTTLEIHCWASSAATVSVDRIEAVLTQDRTRAGAIYAGCRDQAQATLYDSRMTGAVTAR